MSDLIDREVLKSALIKSFSCHSVEHAGDIFAILDASPPIACSRCRHWHDFDPPDEGRMWCEQALDGPGFIVTAADFGCPRFEAADFGCVRFEAAE